MNKDIYLSNSLGGKKDLFTPINKKKVRMYVCGPTVYDEPHIGNARPLVIFDILFKVLKCKYGKSSVLYVRNITDIDDKIIESSKQKKITINKLTKEITKNFNRDCEYLKCEKPSFEPKATENIPQMIDMISVLLEKDNAYENNSHVYFNVSSFKDYGKLSNKNVEDLLAGARVEVSEFKKKPEDFVLWKPSGNDEPGWNSPWGRGRPGWHLECSVMSKKYLGDNFDIHGGGRDLIFPHHENEIAQSRCANESKSFSNYWVHNGFITISNEKMAKSQGNILKIKDFYQKYNGQVLRLALMSTHYKQAMDWNEDLLIQSEKILDKWYEFKKNTKGKVLIPEEDLSPLYDDLNTPGYIANIHKLYEKAFKGSDKDKEIFTTACNFVGLLTETKSQWLEFKKDRLKISESDILQKIKERNLARDNKNYELADKIRNDLLDKGILIEDKDDKTTWKIK
tara:strand:+ start:1634 stop:2995 length:1362 start_codon:yes stop_codon:yes gene_type:complete